MRSVLSERAWPLFLLLIAGLFGLSACEDAAPSTREIFVEHADDSGLHLPPGEEQQPPSGRDDAGRPGTIDDAGNYVPAEYHYILIIAGENERTVPVNGTIDLPVMLFDQRGEGAEGERITYRYVGDAGDTRLSSQRTDTDAEGNARVTFRAGPTAGVYEIEASHPDSRKVLFTVTVADLPMGGLDIGMEYAGPVQLERFEVYVIDDPLFCENPYYLTAPEEPMFEETLEGLQSRVQFDGIFSNKRVSVLVRARRSGSMMLAGGGCEGDIIIPDGTLKRVTVSIFPLPLNPAGSYDMINNFDFTDAIPGTLGNIIRGLVQFFGSQNQEREIAGLIFDQVENLVREAAGSLGAAIVTLVRGWVEDDLNRIINNYIDRDAPDWVRDFFLIGQDMLGIVSYMEVLSRVRISKPRTDGTFDASQNWLGLAVYWRLQCQNNPDPECGRYAYTMDEISTAASGLELVFGQFTGRVHSYDQGVFDSHTLDLQYGRLILFVLNNIILPEIANGATNLRQAMLNLANCPRFANGITGGDSHLRIGGINIVSRDTIEGWCSTIMGLAGDVAQGLIGRLNIDTHLTLDGRLVFIEETDDLVVDRVEGGIWNGLIRTSSDQGPPFEGLFHGEMIDP